jgi:hypothetical protein
MFEPGHDQASGLRRMVGTPELGLMAFPLALGMPAQWIARLAHALRAMGARPVVIDAARGASLSQAFGLDLQYDLLDYLHGAASFDAVAGVTPDGVHVLRAEQGIEAFVASGAPARQLFGALAQMTHGFDVAILAMPADELACMADPLYTVPVVPLSPGEEGLVRTYSTLKQLAEGFGYSRFALVGCDAEGAAQPHPGYQRDHHRIAGIARTYLNAEVSLAGALPGDGCGTPAGLARLAGTLFSTAATPCSLH